MKRNDDKSIYPSSGTCSPARLKQRLSIGSKFHEIFNHICALQKNSFEENKDEQHNSEPDNQASETCSESGQLEIDVVNLNLSNEMPLDSSLLTPDSMMTGEEDTEGYEEQFEEGEEGYERYEEEELDEGIYDDGIIDEESVYRSLPPGLLCEYELAEIDYSAITGEYRSGFPYYSGGIHDDIANSETQNLRVNDNGPSTSRRAHEALASLQNTDWIHQPNFQPSTAGGTEPVNTADLFTQPDLKKEYQKLLRQTYYLTKRAK